MTTQASSAPAQTGLDPSNPVDPALGEAFTVLADVVTALDRPEHPPTASEVRVEMARRTWGGFDPGQFGFSRFRDFLEAASSRAVVAVDWDRVGDVTMTLPPDSRGRSAAAPIRRDLYRAFVDWSGDKVRLLNRVTDVVCEFPRDRAPLEPENITELRRTWVERPDEYVEIPRIPMTDQLQWMNDFADSRRDSYLADELRTALTGPKSARDFTNVLRRHPADLQSWRRLMQDRVRLRVETWRDQHAPDLRIDQSSQAGETSDAATAEAGGAGQPQTSARPETTSHTDRRETSASQPDGRPHPARPTVRPSRSSPTVRDEEVRRRLHRAIDRMPLTELLSLTIPVGYLLED